jgi:HD superfamily phosphohydrolase YqeK
MTKLEKIVFVADFIEPNRKADIFKMYNIRETAYQNLDEAVIKILERSVKYLNDKKSLIDPMTMLTYEYYVNKVE